jgi:hypothetical protein
VADDRGLDRAGRSHIGIAVASVALTAALCMGGACQRAATPEQTNAVDRPHPVTFNKDIAPILYDNCVTCHRPMGHRSADDR